MGARLVSRAFVFAAQTPLTPQETLLLVFMSQTALDTDSPPHYFAARETSAFGLGRMVPDEPAPDAVDAEAIVAERSAAFDRVKKTTAGLVKAGAIVCVRRGREGQRSMYRLTYGEPQRGEIRPPLSSEFRPGQRAKSTRRPGRNSPPIGTTEEPLGEDGEDMGRGTRPSHVPSPRHSDIRTHRHQLEEVA